jgi:hypothetical protein
MASVCPVVCIFGNDCSLLRSRSELLSSLGLCVFTARTLCEAVELVEVLGQTRCDLVLVCHSIGEPDREVFMAYLFMNYPWIRFATVTPDDDRCSDHLLDKLKQVLGIGRPDRDYFLFQ